MRSMIECIHLHTSMGLKGGTDCACVGCNISVAAAFRCEWRTLAHFNQHIKPSMVHRLLEGPNWATPVSTLVDKLKCMPSVFVEKILVYMVKMQSAVWTTSWDHGLQHQHTVCIRLLVLLFCGFSGSSKHNAHVQQSSISSNSLRSTAKQPVSNHTFLTHTMPAGMPAYRAALDRQGAHITPHSP